MDFSDIKHIMDNLRIHRSPEELAALYAEEDERIRLWWWSIQNISAIQAPLILWDLCHYCEKSFHPFNQKYKGFCRSSHYEEYCSERDPKYGYEPSAEEWVLMNQE